MGTTVMGITHSLVPSQTTGPAPLPVTFDGTGTTSTNVASNPFRNITQYWNYGDEFAGESLYGPVKDLNRGLGPIGAHVFQVPGVYTVTQWCDDGVEIVKNTTTITVTDPDDVFEGTNTVCVRSTATGTFAGAPDGSLQVTEPDLSVIMTTYGLTGTRILLRAGDTFTCDPTVDNCTPAEVGPGQVDRFGVGANPILSVTADDPFEHILICRTQWSYNNITFSNASPGVYRFRLGTCVTDADHFMFRNITSTSQESGIIIGNSNNPTNGFIFGCEFSNFYGAGGGIFAGIALGAWDNEEEHPGVQLNIIATGIHYDGGGQWPCRLQQVNYCTTTQSFFGPPKALSATFIFHGATRKGIVVWSEFDNGGIGGMWSSGPASSSRREDMYDLLWDSNVITMSGTSSVTKNCHGIQAKRVTVRNNIVNCKHTTMGLTFAGVNGSNEGSPVGTPASDDILFENNTIRSTSVADVNVVNANAGVTGQPDPTNIVQRGTLVYAPNASEVNIEGGAAVANITTTNSCSVPQAEGTDPDWVNDSTDFTTPFVDFELESTSYAKAAGTDASDNISARYDMKGRKRPAEACSYGALQRYSTITVTE
jgi:hypothetical protein